jgi:hypothetical protein
MVVSVSNAPVSLSRTSRLTTYLVFSSPLGMGGFGIAWKSLEQPEVRKVLKTKTKRIRVVLHRAHNW